MEKKYISIIINVTIIVIFFLSWVTIPFIGWFDEGSSKISISDISEILNFMSNYLDVNDATIKYALYSFYVIPILNGYSIYRKIDTRSSVPTFGIEKIYNIISIIWCVAFILTVFIIKLRLSEGLGNEISSGMIEITLVPYGIIGLSIVNFIVEKSLRD